MFDVVDSDKRRNLLAAGERRMNRPRNFIFLEKIIGYFVNGILMREFSKRREVDRGKRSFQRHPIDLVIFYEGLDCFSNVILSFGIQVNILDVEDGGFRFGEMV